MIHIGKSEKTGEFQVTTIGTNGEVLASSELLSTKAKVFKNALAQRHSFFTHLVYVQDDTAKTPIVYRLEAGCKPEKASDSEMDDQELKIHPKHIVGAKAKKK